MKTLKEKLITFDAVAAARDPEMRKQLLEMAKADNNVLAFTHALNVIALATNKKDM